MTDEPTLDAEVDPRAATPNGWPYPTASDPVAGGAAAIQALATKLDTGPVTTLGSFTSLPGTAREVKLGGHGTYPILFLGPAGDVYVFGASGYLQVAAAGLIVAGMHVMRSHSGLPPQIADPVLGPSNNTNSYTIAFLAPFSAVPVVVTEKNADVFNTTISTTGVTINQTGGSGNQYRGQALGNV